MEFEVWMTHSDRSCELCAWLSGSFWPVGEGPEPPVHPNCRCRRRLAADVNAPLPELARLGVPMHRDGRPFTASDFIRLAQLVRAKRETIRQQDELRVQP